MAGSGGSQPVTLEAPVRARSRGRGARVEAGDDVVDVEGAITAAFDVAPPRHPTPGQEVGVVFDHGGEHDIVRLEAQPVGQLVDGLGGVAAEDGHVVAGRGSRQKARAVARADS